MTFLSNPVSISDTGPVFTHDVYSTRVVSGQVAGVLDMKPDSIQAMDQDSLRSEIEYSIVSGNPASYSSYFTIDKRTGVLRQVRSVDREITQMFELMIKAEEKTKERRSTTSKIMIKVEAKDIYPPVLSVSSSEGRYELDVSLNIKGLKKRT